MTPLKQAIKDAGISQKEWAVSQGVTPKAVIGLIKAGCAVDESGQVHKPTRYSVKSTPPPSQA